MKIDPNRVGLSLGLTFTALHLSWLILYFFGLGELWFKWIRGLHFIRVEYQALEFSFVTAVIGLIGAFILGYLIGFLFGFIWKQLNK